jgi:steroid 5-alpha reductase family enzyme
MGRVGILIFAMGITLETLADAALMRFKRKAENKGRLLTRGLFAWSRHPNYLGEALIWTGLALFAFSTSGAVIVFLSPVLLTFLIIRVSGIPPLEAILGERDGFNEWKARTNAFIPWPPKRS